MVVSAALLLCPECACRTFIYFLIFDIYIHNTIQHEFYIRSLVGIKRKIIIVNAPAHHHPVFTSMSGQWFITPTAASAVCVSHTPPQMHTETNLELVTRIHQPPPYGHHRLMGTTDPPSRRMLEFCAGSSRRHVPCTNTATSMGNKIKSKFMATRHASH